MKESGHISYWDVRVGEQLSIGEGDLKLRVEAKSGQLARLRLEFMRATSVTKVAPAVATLALQGVG